jgi:hypothetical protein
MKTSTLVAGMTGAGVLGGVVGALLFLSFFAESFRPKEAPAPAPAAGGEAQFTAEEADALRRLPKRLEEIQAGVEALRKAGPAPRPGPAGGPGPAAGPEGLPVARLKSNETAAIATLRNLASCQAQIQTTGKIDCDNDGIGEYGTLQEMTGTIGVRKGNDGGSPAGGGFDSQGTPVNPPILSPALSKVDGMGRVTRAGYVFQVFLPDTASPSGFVHETQGGGTAGGTGRVGIDMSETTWCMYAWPEEKGRTGNRVFFVNQAGDVMQSSNENGKHYGADHAMDPSSAFRGSGITSMVAVGTRGQDGDVWKVTN